MSDFSALLMLGNLLFAQGTLQTSSEVIKIITEDAIQRRIVFTADLSAPDFEEDLSAVSQIIFTGSLGALRLDDLGVGGDEKPKDRKFTAAVTFDANTTLAETRSRLTTGPFIFTLISDFGANPPLPKDLRVQKIVPPDEKGRNVRILADMTSAGDVLGDRKIFNVQVGDFSARFRDDGKFNDPKADDMIFTAAIKATDAEIQSFITTNATAAKLNKGTQTKFSGRSALTVAAPAFDTVTFNAGKPTLLNPLTPFVVTNANLPSLRDKSLMVKDLSVVEDLTRTYDPLPPTRGNENGVWSFGKLIAGIAGKSNPEDALQFTVNWVDTKLFSAASNSLSGDSCRERALARATFIRAWLTNSGVKLPPAGIPSDWRSKVKVSRFPVRLMAIINRLDLRGNLAFSLSNVGEGRFVFCFADSNKNGAFGGTVDGLGTMTFILEYGLPLKDCDSVEDYVKGWFMLKDQAWGAAFNQKLQALTDQFTARNAAPERQNGSALNHLRTTEFLQSAKMAPVNGRDWEIRDFELSSGALEYTWNVSPGKEPGSIWNGPRSVPLLRELVTFVNGIDFSKDFNVPDKLRAIAAPMPVLNVQGRNNGLIWVGSSAKDEVMKPVHRREFSLQTCTGCHSAETRITPFVHVRPRSRGAMTSFSSFMVGPSPSANPTQMSLVVDPVAGTALPPKQFNDALRRAIDLADLFFNFKCESSDPFTPTGPIGYRPLKNVH
jgi:hypothetical protein